MIVQTSNQNVFAEVDTRIRATMSSWWLFGICYH